MPLDAGESVLTLAAQTDFLLATTTKHELVIWRIADLRQNRESSAAIRRGCERGASIVLSFDTKVVLQMPRGNIEVVEPRVLLFNKVSRHIYL